MKTIMELVKAQIKPRRSPYRVKPCEQYTNTQNVTGRNFSLSINKQLNFFHQGYAFIMVKEDGLWHFMCEQNGVSKDPFTINPELEQRVYKHMKSIIAYFSCKMVWKYEVLQMKESIVLN